MNGITEWLDHNTDYPLKSPGKFGGVFSDASFLCFDNFIPVLNTITKVGLQLEINITFDDGNQIFTCNIEDITQGSPLRLRTATRNYGVVVFGRLIDDVKSGVFGETIVVNSRFEEVCVRSIDTSLGVYSLNNLHNNVSITLDDNLWYSSDTLNAVSVPSNLERLTTKSAGVYISTSTLQLIEVYSGEATNVFKLDKVYAAICNNNGNIIGLAKTGSSSALYDLQVVPGIKLVDNISYTVTCLINDDSGNLWGLSGGNLLNFGQYPYTSTPIVKNTGLTNIKAITYINDAFLACVDGNTDFANPTKKFSSMFYRLDVSGGSVVKTVAGIMNNPSLNTLSDPKGGEHMPWIKLLTNNGNVLYGVTNSGIVYIIDAATLVAEQYTQLPTTANIGSPISIFNGGVTFTSDQVIPLKTINGVVVDDINQITISGSETIVVNEQNNDTIVFSLPVPDQSLNVRRTKQYE
jgi:hypothetical protein